MKRIIFILFIVLFLFACDKKNNSNQVQEISIASPITNQIQHIDEFRLDKIIVDIEYDEENNQHSVLKKEMVEEFDLKVGYQELKLKDSNLIIPILIYDDIFINDNYIYYYDNVITYGESIYDIDTPSKDDFYFYGWFSDEACSVRYKDGENHIVEVFSGYSMFETFKVDFYLDGEMIERQYVLSGAKYEALDIENDEEFYCWSPNVINVFRDLRLDAVMIKDNYHLVEFYEGDTLIGFKNVKHGENVEIEEPSKEGYIFKGWDQDLKNITKDMKVYATFFKEKLTVRFYSVNGELLETDIVNSGESTTFDSKIEGYNYVSYSHSLDNIYTDLDVIVYTTRKICTYYVDGMVYAIKYYGEKIEVPYKYEHTGYWEEFEEGKFRAVYESNGQRFIFYFIEDNTSYVMYEEEAMSVNWFIYFYEIYGYIYEFFIQETGQKINKPHDIGYQTPEVQIMCYKRDFSNFNYDENISSSEGFIYNEEYDCYDSVSETYDGITYLKGGYDVKYDREIYKVASNIYSNYDIVLLGKDIVEILNIYPIYNHAYIIVDENNSYFYSKNGHLYDKNTDECIYMRGANL